MVTHTAAATSETIILSYFTRWLSRAATIALLVGGPLCLGAQEICDNGVDDDGDGLIDLNDAAECDCALSFQPPSLLPNPSFERYDNIDGACGSLRADAYPDGDGQIACLEGWVNVGEHPAEAFNNLTFSARNTYPYPNAPSYVPAGNGYVGFIAETTTDSVTIDTVRRGYLGAALRNDGQLAVAERYRLSFFLGCGTDAPEDTLAARGSYSLPEAELAIYGVRSRSNMDDISVGCAGSSGGPTGMELIANVKVTGIRGDWTFHSVDFSPSFPYEALVIGGPCEQRQLPGGGAGVNYYFLDEVRLNTVAVHEAESLGVVRVWGDLKCDNDMSYLSPYREGAAYQWYKEGVAILGALNRVFVPNSTGDYRVRIELGGECAISEAVRTPSLELHGNVTISDQFPDTITICVNPDRAVDEPVEVLTAPAAGGLTYSWPGTPSIGNTMQVVEPGTYTAIVRESCVEVEETITVLFGKEADVVARSGDLFCAEQPVAIGAQVSAPDRFTYFWLSPAGRPIAGSMPFVTVDTPGIYRVLLIDGQDEFCPTEKEIEVRRVGELRFTDFGLTRNCGTGTTNLNVMAVGGEILDYYLNDVYLGSDSVNVDLSEGSYSLRVENEGGCTLTSDSFDVAARRNLTLEVSKDWFITQGDFVRLNVEISALPSDSVLVLWSPSMGLSCVDCLSPIANPTETTEYALTVSDTFGCDVLAKVRVVVDRSIKFYLPTAFSPNGDGVNDTFQFFPGRGVARLNQLKIYDRWGGLVYDQAPGDPGWDGTVEGLACEAGVFAYTGSVTKLNGTVQTIAGTFTLMR